MRGRRGRRSLWDTMGVRRPWRLAGDRPDLAGGIPVKRWKSHGFCWVIFWIIFWRIIANSKEHEFQL